MTTTLATNNHEDAFGAMLQKLFPNGFKFCDPFAAGNKGKKGALVDVASETASLNEEDHAYDKSDDKTTTTAASSPGRDTVPRSVSVPSHVEAEEQDVTEKVTNVTSRDLELPATPTTSTKAASGLFPLRLVLVSLFLVVVTGTIGSLEGSHMGSQVNRSMPAPPVAVKELPNTDKKQALFGGAAPKQTPRRRRRIVGPVRLIKNIFGRNKNKGTIEL